ncbi:hypothetical protein MMF93_27065 [Streptomyces tubbatahanensis]|uniref:Uncharacterized protein n=1 Tax=Streptomyces tubbatahanensis TaxID=2923272 RepID=A0ABY3XYW9_9ACTN|nr:hypothetical protein [Streptomyces tubbatahanensis]UNS99701.1 hypothetical protein MMF93_27065 [Streptomyces tubbatahanensis]
MRAKRTPLALADCAYALASAYPLTEVLEGADESSGALQACLQAPARGRSDLAGPLGDAEEAIRDGPH